MKKRLWLTALAVVVALVLAACSGNVEEEDEEFKSWDEGVNVKLVPGPTGGITTGGVTYTFINGDGGMPTLESVAGYGEDRTIKFFILELDIPKVETHYTDEKGQTAGCLSLLLSDRGGTGAGYHWDKNFRDGYDLSAGWVDGDKAYYVFDIAQLPTFSEIQKGYDNVSGSPEEYQGKLHITGYASTPGTKDEDVLGQYRLYTTTQDITGGPPGAVKTKGTANNDIVNDPYSKTVGYYCKNLKLNLQ
jgi:hypothetical protein